MNAVPLRDPHGVVRAWMCGCCLHIGEHTGSARVADAEAVDGSRERAARCCMCACGRQTEPSELDCEACKAAPPPSQLVVTEIKYPVFVSRRP